MQLQPMQALLFQQQFDHNAVEIAPHGFTDAFKLAGEMPGGGRIIIRGRHFFAAQHKEIRHKGSVAAKIQLDIAQRGSD